MPYGIFPSGQCRWRSSVGMATILARRSRPRCAGRGVVLAGSTPTAAFAWLLGQVR
jgi:hypothetical protein